MVALSNTCGKKFPGTERGRYKAFCDVWFWSRHSFLSHLVVVYVSESLFMNFSFFISIFIVYSLFLFYIFPAVVLTICKKTPTELN